MAEESLTDGATCQFSASADAGRLKTDGFWGESGIALALTRLANQVGFGSEDGIDSIGSYWFYCNASNVFGQKCLLCTTDLSHVTDFSEGLK